MLLLVSSNLRNIAESHNVHSVKVGDMPFFGVLYKRCLCFVQRFCWFHRVDSALSGGTFSTPGMQVPRSWVREHGGFVHPAVGIHKGDRGRGAFASKDLAGELCRLPPKLLIRDLDYLDRYCNMFRHTVLGCVRYFFWGGLRLSKKCPTPSPAQVFVESKVKSWQKVQWPLVMSCVWQQRSTRSH